MNNDSKAELSLLATLAGIMLVCCSFLCLKTWAAGPDLTNAKIGTGTTFKSTNAGDNFSSSLDSNMTDKYVHRSETNALGGGGGITTNYLPTVIETNLVTAKGAAAAGALTNILSLTTTTTNGNVMVTFGAQFHDGGSVGNTAIGIRLIDAASNQLAACGLSYSSANEAGEYLEKTYYGPVTGGVVNTFTLQVVRDGNATTSEKWLGDSTNLAVAGVKVHHGTFIRIDQRPYP